MTNQENILKSDFPAKILFKAWMEDKEGGVAPEIRLIALTHYRNHEKGEYVAYLANEIPDEFSKELDSLTLFNPKETNEYFTNRRVAQLNVDSMMHTKITNEIIRNQKGLLEYMALIHGAINLILEDSNNDKKWLQDVQFLFHNLEYIRQNSDKIPEIVIQSMCYTADMLLCSWIEKLLKIACLDKRKELPQKGTKKKQQDKDKLTLGWWLNEKEEAAVEILGETHMKNLQKFLAKYNGVGFNYRNSLAHWDNINKEMLKPIFVSKMLWLFTDVLNTVFVYFLEKRKKLKHQSEQ
jgi:hypothetical protein